MAEYKESHSAALDLGVLLGHIMSGAREQEEAE
jgi:hypothetical protein